MQELADLGLISASGLGCTHVVCKFASRLYSIELFLPAV